MGWVVVQARSRDGIKVEERVISGPYPDEWSADSVAVLWYSTMPRSVEGEEFGYRVEEKQ